MITDIVIEAVGKPLDVDAMRAYLTAQPHVLADQLSPNIYMLGSDDADIDEAREARRREPKRFPMHVILVDVGAERVEISFRVSRVEPARQFVEWLRTQYELKFMDEEFNDLTPYALADLDFLFGSKAT